MNNTPYTEDEVRDKFLRHCNHLAKHWANTDLSGSEFPEDTCLYRIEGFLHSMLATIDGCTLELPAFVLAPNPKGDEDYYNKNGERPYENNINSDIKCDIAGSLRELVNNFK